MKNLVLGLLISVMAVPSLADTKSEVQEVARNTTPLREQELNDWMKKALTVALKKVGRSMESVQFDSWDVCGLGVSTVWAYVKLDDGRKCQVSVRAGGTGSGDWIDSTFQCYLDKKAVTGYSVRMLSTQNSFTNIKVEKSNDNAFVCF